MFDDNDHRRLGQELDLFHLQEEAPGAVFWHPNGLAIMRALESHVLAMCRADGYREVRTPIAMDRSIWESSGHWQQFGDGMLRLADDDNRERALKPVNCPAHLQIAMRQQPSWRDLPMRFAELGIVHRNEPSGVLHGIFRLRQFTQDDGHILCSEEQVAAEVARFVARALQAYRAFGFEKIEVALSTRPAVRLGDDALWDRAEAALRDACAGIPCIMQPGEGAFYGPKIELLLHDRNGRQWQCGTVQIDYVMPERFGVVYVDKDGKKKHPVMLHRAVLGSFERFLGILLEHYDGRLPPWLAPEKLRVLPVAPAHDDYAREVARVVDGSIVSEGSLQKRIAMAHAAKVPFVAIVGDREIQDRSVALRVDNKGRSIPFEHFVQEITARCAPPIVQRISG